jgi:gliding motility associated protien GldN
MKTKPCILVVALILTYSSTNFAQVLGQENARKVVPYSPLREADVMWSKRTWRIIDLREKINQPLYFPIDAIKDRKSLTQTLYQSILEKELNAYGTMDDEFSAELSLTDILQLTTSFETVQVEDMDGNVNDTDVPIPFNPGDVKRYRIKEEWFFDKQRATLEARIIGICPVSEKYDENGDYKGELPLFWVYYPESRNLLANSLVFNTHNDAERRTFEDILRKRMFSSYIYKESNVYDRKIQDYKLDLDLLLEAKAIEDKIFSFEQDLWEY